MTIDTSTGAKAIAPDCMNAGACKGYMQLFAQLSEANRALGEAEGRLAASEMAGVVEGWKARAEAAEAKLETASEALERIKQWGDAYPDDIFPEPDFKRARELLEAGGIDLGSVSASNMRHVAKGVGDIARAALDEMGDG